MSPIRPPCPWTAPVLAEREECAGLCERHARACLIRANIEETDCRAAGEDADEAASLRRDAETWRRAAAAIRGRK